jgi:hypothetical protein
VFVRERKVTKHECEREEGKVIVLKLEGRERERESESE